MKSILVFIVTLLFLSFQSFSQVTLNADGPGDTYSLITSVLAPGYNPLETPDCAHADFGNHIDEIYDSELDEFVFRFHIHTEHDDDRCIKFDRQRNEIKSYSPSPESLLGIEGEIVVYKWKFKLSEGFQSSPNFTHLHQLKSVGGPLASMPMYTLTTRKGSPDRLELRYAETDSQVTLERADLEPFIGHWLEVIETIKYGLEGTYEIIINRVSDNSNLFSYSSNSIINWREDAEFVRPKWGIYRSLLNAQDLRDETVLFADFSIEERGSVAAANLAIDDFNFYYNSDSQLLHLDNCPSEVNLLQVLSVSGQLISRHELRSQSEITINTGNLHSGCYIVNLLGSGIKLSKVFTVAN